MPDASASGQLQKHQHPTRARQVVGLVFFLHGLLFASWAAHIPHVKAHLGLSDGELGLVLLAVPVGSVAAMAVGAWLLPRFGSKRMVSVCLVAYCAAGPFVGLAGTPVELFFALLCWGAFQGTLDVSMNTQAVAQETVTGMRVMSGAHGRWSLGALAGAAAGALGVWLGVSLTVQLLVLGSLALLTVPLCRRLIDADSRHHVDPRDVDPHSHVDPPDRPRIRRLPPAVLLLGLIAFASLICEGAVADWSAVYLRDSLHQSAAFSSLGYGAFILAMVAVRLQADAYFARFDTGRLLSVLAGSAAIVYSIGLASGNAVAGLIGLAALGAGLASVIPSVFAAAGKLPGVPSAIGIAAVSACGWLGYVLGPPVIGQVAAATSLPVALGLLSLLTGLIAVFIRIALPFRRVVGPAQETSS